MARRTKAEAKATREAILDAAEQVFLERGVARTSLQEIACGAGVTRGAVYWHFKNKTDLFDAMLERVQLPLDELVLDAERRAGQDPIAMVRALSLYALRKLAESDQYRRVYTILFHRCEFVDEINPSVDKQNRLAAEARLTLCKLFEQARDRGLLRRGLKPQTAAIAIHAYLLGLYSDWLRKPDAFDIATEAEPLLDAMLAGLTLDR